MPASCLWTPSMVLPIVLRILMPSSVPSLAMMDMPLPWGHNRTTSVLMMVSGSLMTTQCLSQTAQVSCSCMSKLLVAKLVLCMRCICFCRDYSQRKVHGNITFLVLFVFCMWHTFWVVSYSYVIVVIIALEKYSEIQVDVWSKVKNSLYFQEITIDSFVSFIWALYSCQKSS